MRVLILFAAVALSACSTTYDQRMATDFMPTDDGWTYRAYADVSTPLDSAAGEQYRMSMLDIWLKENAMCPAGHEIVSKRSVKRSGAVYDVYYQGRCLN